MSRATIRTPAPRCVPSRDLPATPPRPRALKAGLVPVLGQTARLAPVLNVGIAEIQRQAKAS